MTLAWSQEPAPALRVKVQQLVEQLASPDKTVQEAAAKELVGLGPDILPLLPKAGTPVKPAQGKYLDTIIKELREGQARKEMAPKRVTLEGDAVSLAKALEELTQQTGIVVEDRRQGKPDAKLKLVLKDVPFWQALDTVTREADARIYLYRGKIALIDGPHRETPVSYEGIFRVALERLTAEQDFKTGSRTLLARLEIAWEPRFRPFLVDTRPQSLIIEDDKGRRLPAEEAGGGKSAVENPNAVTIDLRLPAPPRAASGLNLLKGSLGVVGPSKMAEFTFDTLDQLVNNAPAREKTQDGITVRVGRPILDRNAWKVHVTLEYPPGGPEFESFQASSWLVNNEIYLLKEKTGERFPLNGGYATDSFEKNRASLEYNFVEEAKMRLGKPGDWKLVYRTPGTIIDIPVPFEFKDLPLP
jgi:hypothetical protein